MIRSRVAAPRRGRAVGGALPVARRSAALTSATLLGPCCVSERSLTYARLEGKGGDARRPDRRAPGETGRGAAARRVPGRVPEPAAGAGGPLRRRRVRGAGASAPCSARRGCSSPTTTSCPNPGDYLQVDAGAGARVPGARRRRRGPGVLQHVHAPRLGARAGPGRARRAPAHLPVPQLGVLARREARRLPRRRQLRATSTATASRWHRSAARRGARSCSSTSTRPPARCTRRSCPVSRRPRRARRRSRGRLHLVGKRTRDVPVNWKLPVDANIETYHVNTVHRDSAGLLLDQAKTAI